MLRDRLLLKISAILLLLALSLTQAVGTIALTSSGFPFAIAIGAYGTLALGYTGLTIALAHLIYSALCDNSLARALVASLSFTIGALIFAIVYILGSTTEDAYLSVIFSGNTLRAGLTWIGLASWWISLLTVLPLQERNSHAKN